MTQQELQETVAYFNSIRNSNRIWIEVEMRYKDKIQFDEKYKSITGQSVPINFSTYPYYVWHPNAAPNDKWGIELRIYFSSDNSTPTHLLDITKDNSRNGYKQYNKRINNNKLIWELFGNGFMLGNN
jgi:hypothetical protein